MFIQSYGQNKNKEEIAFIAFSLNDLLERMQHEGLSSCRVSFDDIESGKITFRTVTQDDVMAWIKGENPNEQI